MTCNHHSRPPIDLSLFLSISPRPRFSPDLTNFDYSTLDPVTVRATSIMSLSLADGNWNTWKWAAAAAAEGNILPWIQQIVVVQSFSRDIWSTFDERDAQLVYLIEFNCGRWSSSAPEFVKSNQISIHSSGLDNLMQQWETERTKQQTGR